MIVTRKLPQNIVKEDFYLFENDLRIELPPVKITKHRFSFIMENGMAFKWNFKAIPESLLLWKSNLQIPNKNYLIKALLSLKFKIFQLSNKYILAHTTWSENYFHWITDSLPRLFIAKDFVRGSVVFLPQESLSEYYETTLKCFAIKNLKRLNKHHIYVSFNTIIPSFTAETGNFDPRIMKELSLYIKKSLKIDNSGTSINDRELIYVSRRKASKRKVLNEDQLEEILVKNNFKVICFEDYSFLEQVKISNNARIMISIHGAGLTNMLFMSEGSKILELRRKGEKELNCYFSLTSALGHQYYYLQCESDNEYTHLANLTVDINEIERIISQMV